MRNLVLAVIGCLLCGAVWGGDMRITTCESHDMSATVMLTVFQSGPGFQVSGDLQEQPRTESKLVMLAVLAGMCYQTFLAAEEWCMAGFKTESAPKEIAGEDIQINGYCK